MEIELVIGYPKVPLLFLLYFSVYGTDHLDKTLIQSFHGQHSYERTVKFSSSPFPTPPSFSSSTTSSTTTTCSFPPSVMDKINFQT